MENTKCVLVTGASQGIGKAISLSLAKDHSCKVFALSRNESALNELASASSNIIPIVCDLTSKSERKVALNKINSISSHLDGLINNAGFLVNGSLPNLDEEDIRKLFEVNYFSAALLIQECLGLLKKAKSSHIVNIGSMGGFQGSQKFNGLSVYSSSKAALASLSECLAVELAEFGISSNCLNLGAVQTEMLEEAFPGYRAPLDAKSMGKYIAKFALEGHETYNGQSLPVSFSAP